MHDKGKDISDAIFFKQYIWQIHHHYYYSSFFKIVKRLPGLKKMEHEYAVCSMESIVLDYLGSSAIRIFANRFLPTILIALSKIGHSYTAERRFVVLTIPPSTRSISYDVSC